MSTKQRATLTVQERDYTVEEVGEVIRTASSLVRVGDAALATPPKDTLGFGELTELARELGIPQEQLLAAIPEADARRARALKRTKRKMRFWKHLLTYIPVVGGLMAIDYFVTLFGAPGIAVGTVVFAGLWGIGLVMHGLRTYLTGPEGALHRSVYAGELEAEKRKKLT
ncbi:MAG: 2TM domain-containing protein [Deltaproteobacteria bacterium]|nr:2TM domain-containing protein [Deltaproteobacteria bacterium]